MDKTCKCEKVVCNAVYKTKDNFVSIDHIRSRLRSRQKRELGLHLEYSFVAVVYNCMLFSGMSCPTDWDYYNAKCYFVSADSEDHATARTECQSMGTDLASIDDQAEMDFVTSIAYEFLRLLRGRHIQRDVFLSVRPSRQHWSRRRLESTMLDSRRYMALGLCLLMPSLFHNGGFGEFGE